MLLVETRIFPIYLIDAPRRGNLGGLLLTINYKGKHIYNLFIYTTFQNGVSVI